MLALRDFGPSLLLAMALYHLASASPTNLSTGDMISQVDHGADVSNQSADPVDKRGCNSKFWCGSNYTASANALSLSTPFAISMAIIVIAILYSRRFGLRLALLFCPFGVVASPATTTTSDRGMKGPVSSFTIGIPAPTPTPTPTPFVLTQVLPRDGMIFTSGPRLPSSFATVYTQDESPTDSGEDNGHHVILKRQDTDVDGDGVGGHKHNTTSYNFRVYYNWVATPADVVTGGGQSGLFTANEETVVSCCMPETTTMPDLPTITAA